MFHIEPLRKIHSTLGHPISVGTAKKVQMNPFTLHFLAGGLSLSTSYFSYFLLNSVKELIKSRAFGVISKQTINLSSVLLAIPQGGVRFSTYEYLKNNDTIPRVSAVVLADVVSSCVRIPREIINSTAKTNQESSIKAISRIFKKKGLGGFFNGFLASSVRDWPFMIIVFSLNEDLNQKRPLKFLDSYFYMKQNQNSSSLEKSIYGGLSGGLGAILTNPLDTLNPQSLISNRATFHSKPIFKSIPSLFKGASPRAGFWTVVCASFFPLYEQVKTRLEL